MAKPIPQIPGLDNPGSGLEGPSSPYPRDPRVNPANPYAGGSPQGQAFRDMRSAPPNMGPQPQVPPQANGLASKLGAAANAVDANSAAQKAVIGEKLAAVQRGVQGVKDVGSQGARLIGSVMNNPLAQGVIRPLAGFTALSDAADAKKNLDAGNTAGALDSGLSSGAGFLSAMAPGAASGVGTAYLGGHLIGTGIDKALQMSKTGQGVRDWIGGKVNNVANMFGGGVDGSRVDAAESFVRGGPAIAPGGAPGAVKPSSLPQASYSNEGRNPGMRFGPTPPASPFTDSNENGSIGKIVRDGNKFSGVNIGFNGPAGQPSEGFRQDQLELARNAAERAATPMGGVTGIGTRGGSMLDDLVNKHNASKGVDMAGLSPYDRAMMTQQQRTTDKANNVSMRGQDITAQGQVINAQTAARGQDNMLTAQREGNQVSMRGQDISAGTALSGQQNSARIAAAQAAREQWNKDRDHGANQDRLTFEQRQQSDKDLTTQLGSMLTTKDDKGNNVTDHAAVAEHKAGITAFLEGKIREAQSVPPSSPDYAKAQALAERLQKEGPRALGPDRVQQLVAQLSAKKANAENASSWNPLKGVQVDSSDPAAYNIVGKEKNLIFPDQYIHANGARTPSQVIDRKGGSPVFNFGAPMSTQYDSIKREGAR